MPTKTATKAAKPIAKGKVSAAPAKKTTAKPVAKKAAAPKKETTKKAPAKKTTSKKTAKTK